MIIKTICGIQKQANRIPNSLKRSDFTCFLLIEE